MPRPNVREIFERIHPYVDQYARELYGGAQDKGFRHWAFAEKFLEYDLSDTDVVDKTAIDGPDDFEVDGYHIADTEEERVIHLFQCKYRAPGTSMGSIELAGFLEAPDKLLNPEMVVSCRNEETKTLHDNLVRLIPQGYSLNFIWVTSGTISQQARRYAEQNASQTRTVNIGGSLFDIRASFEALDLRDLVSLFQSHLESDDVSLCNWEFDVQPQRCHEVAGDYRTLVVTMPTGQIINLFDRYKYRIFRLNPRGPLGNKTNNEIRETLRDPVLKHMFHLLNNGLSAICDSFTVSGTSLAVRDFQIVNGCQTTVTLWSERASIRGDPQVLINVKLIECPQHFHRFIARTTNTQAPLRAEDFISTDVIQTELQKQFATLSPPWFYQIKRSEWTRMIGGAREKQRYLEEGGGYRWLKSKDVAQALVAFLGFPGEAKDRIRFFFEGAPSSDFGEITYKRLYTPGLSAVQLLLPAFLYRKITAKVTQDKANPELAASFDWLDYSRLHLLWLVGELLRSKYRLSRSPFPTNFSRSLIDSIDEWSTLLYQVVRSSILASVNQAKQSGQYRGHREFFRSSSNYSFMTANLPLALEFARQSGADPLSRLPSL
jgi:hypothetical protein